MMTFRLTLTVFIVMAFPVHSLLLHAASGDPDATFGTGGMVSTDFGGTDDIATAVTIQADGKIVARSKL